MSKYVERNLGRNEEVRMQARVHWIVLVVDIILMVVIIGFFRIIPDIISMFTTELAFTNKNLLGKTGLINIQTLHTPLNKINNVATSHGIFGKLFGYGTITIYTSSGTYTYLCIADPHAFRTNLMNAISQAEDDKIKQQADEMAKAIKGAGPKGTVV